MVDLFMDKILVKNNKDRDELDTEREIVLRLQNRILMLFFGAWDCERCQEFAPTLSDFFKHLTDEFYVERAAQLVLIFVSLDDSEDQQDKFLKELPKRCLFLNHEDPYRKELGEMFDVDEVPRVVVVRPDCSVLLSNGVAEITDLGTDCYRNWQEASEIIDRNFELHEEFDENKTRSLTDPLRRMKYKVEDEKKKKKKKKERKEDDEDNNETEKSPW
ncbi:LOW QUALITY PROTEIN: nucleoredoxin-like protein 1 [Sardina pilchardus]|uniref:LOW QUALITY PROTEIN: nucleoredoxin-like protein 1 n=1 Tax=Sardina pilchardus TaxID=27697 RepID=UPI002E13CD74